MWVLFWSASGKTDAHPIASKGSLRVFFQDVINRYRHHETIKIHFSDNLMELRELTRNNKPF